MKLVSVRSLKIAVAVASLAAMGLAGPAKAALEAWERERMFIKDIYSVAFKVTADHEELKISGDFHVGIDYDSDSTWVGDHFTLRLLDSAAANTKLRKVFEQCHKVALLAANDRKNLKLQVHVTGATFGLDEDDDEEAEEYMVNISSTSLDGAAQVTCSLKGSL
jgi:hypothetical protein